MTKAIYENHAEWRTAAAVMNQFSEKMIAEESTMQIPCHPGTKKYFKERGWIKE